MPKPRHLPLPSDEATSPKPPTSKPTVLTKPNVTKKRSTTEPARPTDTNANSSKGDNEKKKSKVATLRSKFSLKDIGKEFRRDNPPLSSMPKLEGNEGAGTSPIIESQSPNFDEERLYIPKSRPEGAYPASAPLSQPPEFRDSVNSEQGSQESDPAQTPTKTNQDKAKHKPTRSTDSGPSLANARLETLLLDCSSPAARTGECNNSGQAEVIQVQSRACSQKAENGTASQSSPIPQTPPYSANPPTYSPSIYESSVASNAKESNPSFPKQKENKIDKSLPLIVSSDKVRAPLPEDEEGEILNSMPKEPPFLPQKARSREDHQAEPQIPAHGNRFLNGTTSHGGYAPPPPHPGYQNTITLEQQLAAHVDSVHHHLYTAVHKLSGAFENSNNRTTDQILRQVDSVSDMCRLINSRTVSQVESVKEMQRFTIGVRAQLKSIQQETRQTEDKLKAFVSEEINRLREEFSELSFNTRAKATEDSKALGDETQSSRGILKHPKDSGDNKRAPNKKRAHMVEKEERGLVPNPEKKALPGSAQQSKSVSPTSQSGKAAGKSPEQDQIENIPTPTAAFRTPKAENDDIFTDPQPQKTKIPSFKSNPGKELSGSPESRSTKLRNVISQLPALEDKRSLEQQHRESENKPTTINHDGTKTPQKKGSVFSFRRKRDGDSHPSGNRFLRTPRRTKESKPTNEQSPLLASKDLTLTVTSPPPASPSPPSSRPESNINQIIREPSPSPSMVHPALRNPRQRQIMYNREVTSATTGKRPQKRQNQGRRNSSHRFPQSHLHNFRTAAATAVAIANKQSTSTPSSPNIGQTWQFPGNYYNPTFFAHSPTVSSASSIRTVSQRQLTVHYPPSPQGSVYIPQQPPFYPSTGIDAGAWGVPTRPPPTTPTPAPAPMHGQFGMNSGWYRDSYGYGSNASAENVIPAEQVKQINMI